MKALIVIDIQNDYFWDKRKPMFTYDTESFIAKVNDAIDRYQKDGYDIIYIKHILPKLLWGVGFSIRGTEGAELYSGLNIVSDLCFEKSHSDTYTSKPFCEFMKKKAYDEIVLCGIDECGCVGATAQGAVRGFCEGALGESARGSSPRVKMLSECIGSRFAETKVLKMREKLKKLGVEYI